MDLSICPFCHEAVPSLDLERHANYHFEDEELATDLELARQISLMNDDLPTNGNAGENDGHGTGMNDEIRSNGVECEIDEKICCLIGLQIRATFHKVEAGLMALLRRCLEWDSENSTSILSGYVDHFQSIESVDVGWGCGWRNIQMLSSHLLAERQEAREVLFGGCGFVPDIASLQRWLEIAWQRGFDVLGSSHFDMEIYGQRKWIGTVECAALFRSFGLRARIVDFDSKKVILTPGSGQQKRDEEKRKAVLVYGPMDRFLSRGNLSVPIEVSSGQPRPSSSQVNSNPVTLSGSGSTQAVAGYAKGHQILMEWVWNYFVGSDMCKSKSGNARVVVSEKTPLYFQHDGHSRTIIGIQVKHQKNGMRQHNLLILDPADKTAALERSLRENVGWQKLIKRGAHTLRKLQYQLCYLDSGVAYGDEMEQLKTLDSIYLEF